MVNCLVKAFTIQGSRYKWAGFGPLADLVCNPMLVGIPIIALIIGPPPISAAPGVPPP